MELKDQDLKLLSYLYHSYREPLSKIAKATKMTRTQVEYKLKKYSEEGLIKKNILMVNYGTLGYNLYIFLLIKLEKPSRQNRTTKLLESTNRCISWGECFGSYDLYANMIFKNEEDMGKAISKIVESPNAVEDYLVMRPYLAEYHPLKIIDKEKQLILPLASSKIEGVKLDETDMKILKFLEKDGRMKVVDIANKLDSSVEKIMYRLKNLKDRKIISGLRLHLDLKKIGYSLSGFFMDIKNFSDSTKKKLIKFSREHRFVNALVLSLTKPNCFIQIFHKTEDELKKTITEVKQFLGEEFIDFDILLLNEEDKVNTLPFLNVENRK